MKLTKSKLKEIIREELQKTTKFKGLLKESYAWERKFGESLPTLADTTARHATKQEGKLTEAIATVGYSKEMGAIYVSKRGQAGGKSLELYKKDIEEIIKMYKQHKRDMD